MLPDRRFTMKTNAMAVVGAVLLGATTASAQEWGPHVSLALSGYSEVPAISSPASGRFLARGSVDGTRIQWQLTYENLAGEVTQAHIHLGATGTNGGISLFLCSNLGNGPVGTQLCPATAPAGAPVTGISTAADVIGPAAQGIAPGEFNELIAAALAGKAYVNVHTTLHPGGEIRVQLPSGDPR
jgi:hypothetical protein